MSYSELFQYPPYDSGGRVDGAGVSHDRNDGAAPRSGRYNNAGQREYGETSAIINQRATSVTNTNSELGNRMITGTGRSIAASAYYLVMGMTYYSGLKVKKDY